MANQQDQAPLGSSKVTIEIGNRMNQNFRFGPTDEVLRGCWDGSHVATVAGEVLQGIHSLGPIPGIRVTVDQKKRIVSRYDPLVETEQGRELWNRLDANFKKNRACFPACQPLPTVVREDCTADDIKEWLYAMRQAVDSDIAKVLDGTLPSMNEIRAMPGKRRKSFFDTVVREDKDRWTDEVPVSGSKAATT